MVEKMGRLRGEFRKAGSAEHFWANEDKSFHFLIILSKSWVIFGIPKTFMQSVSLSFVHLLSLGESRIPTSAFAQSKNDGSPIAHLKFGAMLPKDNY